MLFFSLTYSMQQKIFLFFSVDNKGKHLVNSSCMNIEQPPHFKNSE